MTPEEHKMLLEVRETVAQNTKILESIKKTNKASLYLKILYWFIIIGVSFGAFYFVQPYIEILKTVYGNFSI